jgi:hypothetical protein
VVSLATGRKKGVLEIKEKERERGSGKGSGCVARHRALSQGCAAWASSWVLSIDAVEGRQKACRHMCS